MDSFEAVDPCTSAVQLSDPEGILDQLIVSELVDESAVGSTASFHVDRIPVAVKAMQHRSREVLQQFLRRLVVLQDGV